MSSRNDYIIPALKAAAIYAVFGGLWILLSDKILAILVTDMETYAAIQTYKGWAYILITAILVFKVSQSYLKEAVEVQDHLKLQEERYQLAMRGSNIGTWDWDIENGDAVFNEEYAQMLGYDADSLPPIYESWEATLHPDDKPKALEQLQAHLTGETPEYKSEFRMLTSEKKWKWVLARGMVCHRDTDGNPLRMVGTHMDLTRQREEKEALESAKEIAEAANSSREQFLSKMSHEIRTPLNSMFGMLRLLRDGDLTADQRDFLASAEASGASLLAIVNDLMSLSQGENAPVAACHETLDLNELTESVGRIFRAQLDNLNVQLSFDIDETIATEVCGDQDKLRQVLFNLVSSALQFAPKGKVVVRIESIADIRDPKRLIVLFTVTDSGKGFTYDEMSTIFDPFAQVEGKENIGLGLRIASRLITAMGGNICVDSDPGNGTTVSFTIIAHPLFMNERRPAAQPSIKSPSSSLHVLLVEDDPINRVVATRFLGKLGHTSREASNGAEAIDTLRHNDFDCILMDIKMPIMNGIEATRSIRESSSLGVKASIPIIAATAHTMDDEDGNMAEVGFNGFLTKPMSLEALDAELHRAMTTTRKS